jgi:predicted metal-dependent peptidase
MTMQAAIAQAFDYHALSTVLKKAHIALMRHPETCLYSGVILMGESSVIENCPTAYTDGFNKRYGAAFIQTLPEIELRGLVLHENLHVLLKHIPRHRDLMKADGKLANAAMDYVDNAIIMAIKDKTLCALPAGGLYDERFINWSVREVYDYLKTGQTKQPQQGKGKPLPNGTPSRNTDSTGGETVTIGGETFPIGGTDEHDGEAMVGDMTGKELKKLSDDIDEAVRQGSILAGRFGATIPRAVTDMLKPSVNWKEQFKEYVSNCVRGMDEFTWRRFNRRRLADDNYMPTTISETVGEIIYAIDTSGSITQEMLNQASGELASLCEVCIPDRVRVLWWDTKVHGEQVFEGNYENLRNLLKPQGGGGTRAGSVAEYILKNNIAADCVIVVTDGYLEAEGSQLPWEIQHPTLWLVTQNTRFTAPANGTVITIEED